MKNIFSPILNKDASVTVTKKQGEWRVSDIDKVVLFKGSAKQTFYYLKSKNKLKPFCPMSSLFNTHIVGRVGYPKNVHKTQSYLDLQVRMAINHFKFISTMVATAKRKNRRLKRTEKMFTHISQLKREREEQSDAYFLYWTRISNALKAPTAIALGGCQ